MPVSATSSPDIVRVSFPVGGEGDDRHETEIVCFLRIGDAGLDITYSHHIIRSRESTVGPLTQETERRMSLTPALKAVVQQGVFLEFWSTFNRGVRVSPGRIGKLPNDETEYPVDPRLV